MKTCCHIGCGCEAAFVLKACIPNAHGRPLLAAEGLLGVEMCPDHAESAELDAEWLMHPAIQMLFRDVIEGGTEPDWDSAYLELVPINSPEHRAWLGAMTVN